MTSTMRFDRWEKPDASQAVSFDQLAGGTGLVPIAAPTVNFSGGAATSNTLNEIEFSGITSISLNNIFTSDYRYYRIAINYRNNSGNFLLYGRFRSSGSDISTAYYGGSLYSSYTGTLAFSDGRNNGNNAYLSSASNSMSTFTEIDIHSEAGASTVKYTSVLAHLGYYQLGGYKMDTASKPDGFTLYVSGGNISGTLTVYGYKA